MNSKSMITAMIAVGMIVVLLTTTLIPMVDDASKQKIEIIGNDDPSWIRMSYYTTKLDDSVSVSFGTQYTVGSQSGSEDVIFYADSSSVIYSENGRFWLYNDTEEIMLNSPFTITVSEYTTIVNDGNEYILPQHSWMYFPDPDGHCTTYYDTGFRSDTPVAAVSETFAGVKCYNNENGINMTVVKNGETIEDVYWGKTATRMANAPPVQNNTPQFSMGNTPTPTRANSGDWTYTTSGTDATITGYNGSNTVVVIPDTLDGYTVTTIGTSAFSGNTDITSVTIPNSVTSIGDYAFYYCTSLSSVTIGNSVESIGGSAFSNCTSLTSVTIPDSVTTIGAGAFAITSLTSVNIPNSVTSIGYNAFSECTSLSSVTIGNSVTSINGYAFNKCTSLTAIEIKSVPTTIGNGAFSLGTQSNPVTCTVYSPNNIANGVFDAYKNEYTTFNYNDVWSYSQFGTGAIIDGYNGSDTIVTIPDTINGLTVTNIEGTFYNNTTITSVTIPNTVTSIGASTFNGCTSLTTVNIPNSVTTISNSAFGSCSSLGSITIPNSVTTIHSQAFTRCTSLTTINMISVPTTIGTGAFTLGSSTVPVTCTVYSPNNIANGTLDAYKNEYTTFIYDTLAEVTHTIIYDGNGNTGGTTSPTVVTDYYSGNTPVTFAANGFTKTNWHFIGWKVGNTIYQPGQTIDVAGNSSVTAIAQWEEDPKYTHTVIYDRGAGTGGSTPDTVVTDYNSGNTAVALASNGFTKTNWHFIGWLYNGTTYQPGETVNVAGNSSITVTAQWEEDPKYTHTIVYNPGSGEGTMTDTVVTDYNSGNTAVTLAANGFTKTNYYFVGWLYNGTTYQPGQTIDVAGNSSVTVTALWDEYPRYTHTITYDMGSGTGGSTPDTVVTDYNDGQTNVMLSNCGFTKTNWHFIGWLVNGTVYQVGQTIPVIGNGTVTATAQWEEDPKYTHTITYNPGTGQGTMSDTVITDYNSGNTAVTLAQNGFTKTNWHFVGWLVNGTIYNENVGIDVVGNGTVTAIAQWEEDPKYTHTITYDMGSGTSGSTADTTITDYNSGNTNVTLAQNGFTKTNWHFVGWLVNGTVYQAGQTVAVGGNQSVTATAQWEEDPKYTHTITYNGNSNTGGSTADTVVTDYIYGDTMVTFAECGFTKTNWHFIGWKLYNQGPIYQPGQSIAIRGNATATAYAQWEEDPKYTHTVIYDGNDSIGTMANTVVIDYNSGESDVILSECRFTKQYNYFAGWLVNGTIYNEGDAVKVEGNQSVIAKAVWELVTYTSGDWNYTVKNDVATITKYTATPVGNIVIPSSLDGFMVMMVGDGTPIITNESSDWTVDMRNVRAVNNNAFKDCTHLTGSITLSSNVIYIGHDAFNGTGITDMVSYLSSDAVIEDDAFANTSITEVLNLGTMDMTGDSFGLNATVKDELEISMCVGDNADTYTKIVGKGNIYTLIPMISIVIVAGLLIGVTGFLLGKRE